MKNKYLLLLLILTLNLTAKSQISYNCDPFTTGVSVYKVSNLVTSTGTLGVGEEGIIKFNLFNNGSDLDCIIPVNRMKVVISFPTFSSGPKPYLYNGAASIFHTDYFTWTYDATENVLVGLNRWPIPVPPPLPVGNSIGVSIVSVPIIGNSVGPCTTPFNISVVVGAPGVDNNPTGDNINIPLSIVAGTTPVTLNDIEGKGENCSAVLKWSTYNELNFNRFEIESSADGNQFSAVGTVKPHAGGNGGAYVFNYSKQSGKAFYRLKMIDNDGSYKYSKIVPIVVSCNENKFVKVFPNPVIINQRLTVNIVGYDAAVKGELFSATGQLVKTYTLRNGSNTIPIENMAQGFYTLRISENGIATETIKVNVFK
jgi:Secretion system C-terminal sorting domain